MIAPGVMHKSDIGGVIMGLQSPLAVAEAAVTLADRARTAGAALEGVLLQREVQGGIEALVKVLQRVSALIEAIPELTEMDLNPVKVLPPGKGAVVVDARMRLHPTPKHL